MSKPPSIFVQESGGIIVEMDLPLPEAILGRLNSGSLREVTVEGVEVTGDPVKPAAGASKSDWVGYLVRAYGIDPDRAEAMTKQDMVDMVNQLEA